MDILLSQRSEHGNVPDLYGIAGRDKPTLQLIFQQVILFVTFMTVMGCSSALFGQQRNHYRFQLQGVTDVGGAKMVTDILRPVFNTTEEPYAVFPSFNDQLDLFDFVGDLLVTKEQLDAALAPHGLVLINFSNTDQVTPETQKQ